MPKIIAIINEFTNTGARVQHLHRNLGRVKRQEEILLHINEGRKPES